MGVAVVAIGGVGPDELLSTSEQQMLAEATSLAEVNGIPLLALPSATLNEIEHDLIAHLMTRRDHQLQNIEPSAADVARLRAGLRIEALEALITGTYAGETSMRARAFQLGYDLTRPHALLWVDLAPQTPTPTHALGPRGADPMALHLANELTVTLNSWARPREMQVAALVPLDGMERGPGDLVERASGLLARVLGQAKQDWSAAVSEPANQPSEVHSRANEARDTAKLGFLILGPRHIARLSDLGVYQLLLELKETGQLEGFVERTLGPILADSRNGGRLLETLEKFFACNGNLQETARQLHLHRNSLTYRLAHAGALLGRDLDDPELRLALHLAIKGRQVIAL
jgi:purine catabolism regulator